MERRRSPSSLLTATVNGLGAGLAATAAMSALMVAAGRIGLMGRHPPSKIGDRLLDRVRPFHSPDTVDAFGTAIHYAIGAALGIAFALLRRLIVPFRLPGAGVAYALGVWATSYAGLLPALRIMPAPDRDRPGRQPIMIASHVVFGLVLGLLTRRLKGSNTATR